MKKLLTVIALGLLATACVSHDADEVAVEPVEPARWQQPQPQPRPQPIIVKQPQAQKIAVAKEARPAQKPWWQENKQKHVVKVVVPTCPCKDPNDPCTHCYQK